MLKTLTPINIDEYTVDGVLDLIEDVDDSIPNKRIRLNLVKLIYQVLGLDLTPDVALAMASHYNKQVILALAGGGKTTQAQTKIILDKIILKKKLGRELYGQRVLCLVYNDHNVSPMKATHSKLVNRLYSSGIEWLTIDADINAMTMHSFCKLWVSEYEVDCGFVGSKVISNEATSISLMRNSYMAISKKYNLNPLANFSTLFRMYTYMKECLLTPNSEELREHFPEVTLTTEQLEALFNFYDTLKKTRKMHDFVDWLVALRQLMIEREDVRNRIQENYEYVIADEVQDFTPIMYDLLRLITGKNPLLAIGDEDQTIYRFKGANVSNLMNFIEDLEDPKIFTFNFNRRCRKNILDYGSKIITRNSFRFDKKLIAVKEGGNIELIGYNTEEGQLLNVVKRIESMSVQEAEDTVIAYRDRKYSIWLAEMLEERNIPFNMLSGFMPFSHEMYGHVQDVLDLLYDPLDPDMHLHLHKVLPFTSKDNMEVVGWDPVRRKFKDGGERVHFLQRDYGRFSEYKTFMSELRKLAEISQKIGTESLRSYFPEVFEMICKYYWNYKKQNSSNPSFDELYTERVKDFFNVDKTYEEVFKDLSKRISTCKRYTEVKAGVTLGTYHSLKGLEFKNVIMIYMDDSIFPSLDIGVRGEVNLGELEEDENRLAYVAVTRAIDNLTLFYNIRNPSTYVKILLEGGDSVGKVEGEPKEVEEVNVSDVLGDISLDSNRSTRKSSFLDSVLGNL